MEEKELIERLTKVEELGKNNSGKITELEEQYDLMHEMNLNIKLIAQQNVTTEKSIKEIKEEVTGLKDEVTDIKMSPAKKWNEITWDASKWIILALVAYLVGNVLPFLK